jgi:pimeloyl-ACP methyl ester carboxylesterase
MFSHSAENSIKNNHIDSYTQNRKAQPEAFIIKLFQTGFKIGDRLFPALSGRIACRLWMTPPRFKTPASERQALESATMETIKVGNNDITTFSWGQSGPTVLLVHGWSGRGTQLGSFVEPLIEAGYRVLSFDAPAHGKSSGKQTNLYEIAATILALQLRYGKFDAVISHSFGNPCTALAVRRGLKVRRLVSISPPATMTGLIDKFAEALHIPAKTKDKLIQRLENTFGEHIWEELSMKNSVKKITIPGLVIHDVHDTDVSWEEGQAVAHAWNNAPFKITTGLGHRRILRDKEVIKSAVAFINKQNP